MSRRSTLVFGLLMISGGLMWTGRILKGYEERIKTLESYNNALEDSIILKSAERDVCRKKFAQYMIEHEPELR